MENKTGRLGRRRWNRVRGTTVRGAGSVFVDLAVTVVTYVLTRITGYLYGSMNPRTVRRTGGGEGEVNTHLYINITV